MTQKTKQIGFISAMVISVGSTVGAGIFFKNGSVFSNADGKLPFMIASWVVAAIGVLGIAMALIELASASKGNGITEYTTRFTKKRFAKFSSAYMVLVYLPLNYFAMPLYAAMSMQDAMQAGNPNITMSGWSIAGIAFAFFLWFALTGFFQKKFAIKSQWIYTVIKYLPLAIIPIFAMVQAGNDGVTTTVASKVGTATGLTAVSPWLGIMASIPAILFAFDGFYTVTSVKSNLKDEKKMGPIIAISLAIITSTYLFYGIITGLAGAGSMGDISNIPVWLKTTFNIFIMFAVFGIINGFGVATPEIYYQTYNENPVGIVDLTKKVFKIKDNKLASFVTSMTFAVLAIIILTPIGIYATSPSSDYVGYGSVAGLYTLADYATNYTSLAVFVFIGSAILGAVINRKKEFVKVEKYKWFMPAAIVALVFLTIATLYMVANNIAGMTGFKGATSQTEIVKFCIMIGTLVISFIPVLIDFAKPYNDSIKKPFVLFGSTVKKSFANILKR